jgi:alpha-1,2-mannosyltransferase
MNQFTTAKASPIRALWWCALSVVVAFFVLAFVRTRLSHEPERVFAVNSLRPADQRDDSWLPMNTAFDYVRSTHVTPVYTKVFLQDHIKFQYPLTSLFIFYVFRSSTTLNTISLIIILLTCPLMVALFNRFLAMASPAREANGRVVETWSDRIGRVALPLLMILTFYPLVNAYRLGQLQVWLFAGFMLLVWLWTENRYIAAGVLAGILTCGKPQFGLLLIWAATRRKWSFCAAFMVVAAAAGLMSLGLYGVSDNLNYLRILSELSHHGESFWLNQSVNGLLNRAFYRDASYVWQTLPPYNNIVYFATLLSSVALIAGALFVPAKFRGGIADLLLAAFTSVIASPVAWVHHYTIVLPVFAAIFAWSTQVRPLGRWTLPTIVTGYILVGTYQGAFVKYATTRLNFLESYPLAGVLITLVLLYVWVIRGEPRANARVAPTISSGDNESLGRPLSTPTVVV